MRKFILFFLLFFCFVASAQQKKNYVKKSSTNVEHLTFMGIPINGKYENFITKLRAKGFRKDGNFIVGNVYGNNAEVHIYEDDYGNVYSVNTSIYFDNIVLDNICKRIEQTYNCVRHDCYYHEMHSHNVKDIIYYVYSNNRKKIGEIHVSFHTMNTYDISVSYNDLTNERKYNKYYDDNSWKLDGNEKIIGTLTGIKNCSKVIMSKKQNSEGLYLKIFPSDNNRDDVVKYVVLGDDVKYFNNYLSTCNTKVSFYFLNWFLNLTRDTRYIHVFHNMFYDQIQAYYEEIEEEKQKQLAQRRKSFGFMDLLHMLAPGFFTKDDVELWNKLPESDQKAIIQGSVGAYFGMGDTRGHTEKMHTPSLRNQQ